jgi:hypothetical protein
VKHSIDVVILVHDHYRDVAIAALGDRDRGPVGDVDDRKAVERVPVHPDHGLMVDRSRRPVVLQLVHATGVGLERGEHPVGLGTNEVLNSYGYGHREPPWS